MKGMSLEDNGLQSHTGKPEWFPIMRLLSQNLFI